MTRLLSTVLRMLGVVLYCAGLHRAIIWLRRRQVRVLAYHACEKRESDFTAGLQSNTTPQEFAAQLEFYARNYNVIPLGQVESGEAPHRAAVIVFDDGYRSVLQNALPLLRRRGMPSTVFLVTRVLDNHELVWVNELNWFLRRYPAISGPVVARLAGCATNASPADMIAAMCDRYDHAAIQSALTEIRTATGVNAGDLAANAQLYLTWHEVEEMRSQQVTFGNHTASHAPLPALSSGDLRAEIDQARRALNAAKCNGGWLAYPFGRSNGNTRAAAVELGCTMMFEVGLAPGSLNLHSVGRIPVRAPNAASLFAQIEIVEPAKAWLRRLVHREGQRSVTIARQPLQAASTRTTS